MGLNTKGTEGRIQSHARVGLKPVITVNDWSNVDLNRVVIKIFVT